MKNKKWTWFEVVSWVTGLLGIALLVMLGWVLTYSNPSEWRVVRFDQVSRCVETVNTAPLNTQGIAAILDAPVFTQPSCWQTVTLPENNPAQSVRIKLQNPELRRVWYRVPYQVPDNWDSSQPLMVYVPRILAYAWQVRVDGQSVTDNRYDWRSTWNRPVSASFFVKPNQASQTIQIELGVIASIAEGYSVSRISVGDASNLRSLKAKREYFQVTMPQAASAVMLLLGLFFFSFWLARRAEIEYLLLALGCVAFSVSNLQYTLARPDAPALDAWYVALVHDCPMPWLIFMTSIFAERLASYRLPRLNHLLWLHVIIISFISLPLFSLPYEYRLLKVIIYTVAGVATIGIVIWKAIVTGNTGLRIISVVLVLAAFIGTHDMVLLANRINPENLFLIPYGGLAYFSTCIYVIQRRYVGAINNQEQLNKNLEVELIEKGLLADELRSQQNRLLELERAQTLANERQRLIHDMHDGLGSSLLSTLAAVEHNHLPHEAVVCALRACVDDLRLVIDSMEPSNDLVILLATVRYRLGQRLSAAGLDLVWDINDLPPLAWLEPTDALNILRLVQEALTNVLKHAHASNIRVTTRHVGQQVEIQIADNGNGYDANAITLGRGLHSQRIRAERLGGQLHINSVVGGGTTLCLRLPVTKNTQ